MPKGLLSSLFLTCCFTLVGACSSSSTPSKDDTAEQPDPSAKSPSTSAFSIADARNNLKFAGQQYLKMQRLVDNDSEVELAPNCVKDSTMLCYPRSEEHEKIYLEQHKKWTNGFYPGVLWQLVIADSLSPSLSAADKAYLIEKAELYTKHLEAESRRGATHDLGFILNNSFGLGLQYAGISDENEAFYQDMMTTGRDTLVTRYRAEKGLIRSWDWEPGYHVRFLDEEGNIDRQKLKLSNPWQYPVIVDNMMNLEFLLASDKEEHRTIAYNHAANTYKNHYFYDFDDPNKERPISYHVFDYNEMKPGNWQGLGHISAWSRGQGWSFYGFVSVAEFAAQSTDSAAKQADYLAITKKMLGTLKHLLRDDPVPMWDFFADRDNAQEVAAYTGNDTARYSGILDVCDFLIPDDQLPYKGWAPILFDQDILATESLTFLQSKTPVKGDKFLIDGKVAPCGTEPYDLANRSIPKDTSAASIYAAGAYRLAQMTQDEAERADYIAFADRIMAELTKSYRTDKGDMDNFDLGFVLHSATGNLPSKSEIDTSIVYADYYFIEANMRKLQLAQ